MAIGKVNAYATVQAPNVDFGEIALNAQKFQDADIERQKEMKAAQAKAQQPKPFKEGKEAPTYTANTGLKGLNEVSTSFFQDNMTRLQLLNNKEANEGLSPQEVAEQTQLKTSGKQIYDFVTALTTTMKEDNSLISTASEVSSEGIDLYQKALKGKGLDRFEMTSDGDIKAYFYKTKEDPITHEISLDLDKDGKPQTLTKEDGNGNIVPSTLSYKDVVYGDFKERIVQPTDVNKLVDEIVKGTGYNTFGTDTGTVKDVSKNVTSSGLATMKLNIKENLLKNNNSTLDILSRMAKTNTYKEKLSGYKYTGLRKITDEELSLATEYVNSLAVSKLDTSNVKDVIAPSKDGGDGSGGSNKANPRLGSQVIISLSNYTPVGGKKKSTPYAYTIPLLEANNVATYKGIPMTPSAIGIDKDGNRFLKFSVAQSEIQSVKLGQGSKSRAYKTLKDGTIYLEGPDAQTDDFMNIMSVIKNPETGNKFQNTYEVKNAINSILEREGKSVKDFEKYYTKKTSSVKKESVAEKMRRAAKAGK